VQKALKFELAKVQKSYNYAKKIPSFFQIKTLENII